MPYDPIYWKSKIITAKAETVYGQDAGPTALANAMLMTDVQYQPMEGEDVSRNLDLPYQGAQSKLPTGLRGVLTGSVELIGSGTPGKPPAWGPLLRACAAAQIVTADTSVEYVPISEGHESVTIGFMIGRWRHQLLGAKGTGVLTLNAQGIPVLRFTLTGLFVTPDDQARPSATYTDWQRPDVASKQNTPLFRIGAVDFVMRSYELNLGRDVQPRLLVGLERILIVDQAETLTCTVEAVAAGVYNPFAIAQAGTQQAVTLNHGTVAGRRVEVTVPYAEQARPGGVQNNQGVVEWPLGFTPLPRVGNDQWKIKLT